jgi:hypothetical protein
MPANPPPVIDDGLALIAQKLLRSDMSRAAEVTFALTTGPGATLAIAQDTIDDFQVSFNGAWAATFDSEVSILPPTIRLGTGTDTPYEATAGGAGTVGGSANAFPPPQVACLFKKGTGVGGRKNRGRTYFPFLLSNANVTENGNLVAGVAAALTTVGNTWLAALLADTSPMVIANKVIDHSFTPPRVTFVHIGEQVTSFSCEQLVATQRRRLGR